MDTGCLHAHKNSVGKVVKVFKVCSDITAAKQEAEASQRDVVAISKSLAMIEFTLTGLLDMQTKTS